MDETTFQTLLVRAKAGDRRAQDQIATLLYRIAADVLEKNPPSIFRGAVLGGVLDVCQNAVVAVTRNLHRFKGTLVGLRGYLVVALCNKARDWLRQNPPGRAPVPWDEVPERGGPGGFPDWDRMEDLIESLGQPCFGLLRLRFEGYKPLEIVERLGVDRVAEFLGTDVRDLSNLSKLVSRRTLECGEQLRARIAA